MGKDSKKSASSSKSKVNEPVKEAIVDSPISLLKDGGVKISVHVKPGAKTTQVTDFGDDSVGIQLAAQPKEGEANQELVDFLSEVLKLKKYQVTLISGHKSREKVVRVEGMDVETVQRLLQLS
ncbi:hypothetical protein SmJEL517_g03494 [Synchytrium microbalum]|uniref:Uncharacterized protein n=1 Tax=Synchytrium microbalum TaxID=1806994 RepID=A0A507C2T8_9FUNG|nr:uncharacterized protein SmJEL517_g03494 [Synchytrium microbalum]TPX33678.1 hypothetical protein SmJEL517_g03494 [Synchytrium microbalum]